MRPSPRARELLHALPLVLLTAGNCALPVFALFACALSACAHTGYRVVKESETGGEVALEGDQKEARPQAEGYMRGRCGSPGYAVDHEGASSGAGSFRGADDSWRIAYHCNPKDPHVDDERDESRLVAGDGGKGAH